MTSEQPATNINVRVTQAPKPPGCGAVLLLGLLFLIALSGWKTALFAGAVVAIGVYLGVRRR